MHQELAYFNSNDGTSRLALGMTHQLVMGSERDSLSELDQFLSNHQGKDIVLAISYDLKNKIENLTSNNSDHVGIPEVVAWVPSTVVLLEGEMITEVRGDYSPNLQYDVEDFFRSKEQSSQAFPHFFEPTISREEYIRRVKELKKAIQHGTVYEVNFCHEYLAENVTIENPQSYYHKLNAITKAPFSCYMNFDNFCIFSGSPERFLSRKGQRLISEPIKGTRRRGATVKEDEALKEELYNDPKERSENIMIVDLVRNDLSRIASPASVKVEELFGIYTFETVHQLISRVVCDIPSSTSFSEILRATFPMGSMTGAPKISAMELIESQESFKRGLYSGTVGFVEPNGDFELNVMIRSILHNRAKRISSCSVGSAITVLSDPALEYEECQTKIRRILDGMHGES